MLRFFRQIRQRLLTENKFSKYMLYAIGEILLVVIGILIALQVDIWRSDREIEEQVTSIHLEIMDELKENIDQADAMIQNYFLTDSLCWAVNQNNHRSADFTDLTIADRFYALPGSFNHFSFTQHGFEKLLQFQDSAPEKFNTVGNKLSDLSLAREPLDNYFNLMLDQGLKVNTRWSEEFEWYASAEPLNENEGFIDYVKNDYRYKGEVRIWHSLVSGLLRDLAKFRSLAIECHDELADLHKRPKYGIDHKVNEQLAKSIVGRYEYEGESSQGEYIFQRDNRFWILKKGESVPRELYILADHKTFEVPGNRYKTIIMDNAKSAVLKTNRMVELSRVGQLSRVEKARCFSIVDSILKSN